MKQNFAGQPDGGGALGYAGPFPTLTGKDLMSDVSPMQSTIFTPYPRFVDNCKNCNSMKNASGDYSYSYEYQQTYDYPQDGSQAQASPKSGGFSWGNWNLADIFKTAGNIYTTTAQNQALKDQASLALQIEQQKAAKAKADAAAAAAKSSSVASTIKAYSTPIIITGLVGIAGIAAYFYFKKKK